jgi:hypothetical protein
MDEELRAVLQPLLDKKDAETAQGIVRHSPKRKVCGKPHRTRESAERGQRAAKSWGWDEVEIEEKPHYFVVTGIPLPDVNHDSKPGISNPIQGRYRWPSK